MINVLNVPIPIFLKLNRILRNILIVVVIKHFGSEEADKVRNQFQHYSFFAVFKDQPPTPPSRAQEVLREGKAETGDVSG